MSTSPAPYQDPPDRTVLNIPRVKAYLDGLIEGRPYREAARTAGLRLNRARRLLGNPAFRREYMKGIEVLRESERARNLALAVHLRDQGFDPTASAAAQKMAMEGARYLDGNEGRNGVTVNVGVSIGPGLVIDLSDDPRPEPGTIEHSPLR